MPQAYVEHDADVGVIGRGATPEQAFAAAAAAMFALQGDLDAVGDSESVAVEFEEADLELALVAWLNALLGHAKIGGVAAFDPDEGGIISARGVGFDISCGIRCLRRHMCIKG